MNVELDPDVDPHKDVTIAVDSTGVKVSNRGEWIRHKWRVKRGFVKVHLAVDTKTGKILSMEVTKEDVSDGRMLKQLVEEAASNAHIVKAIADGGYDSKDNFQTLDSMRIVVGHESEEELVHEGERMHAKKVRGHGTAEGLQEVEEET